MGSQGQGLLHFSLGGEALGKREGTFSSARDVCRYFRCCKCVSHMFQMYLILLTVKICNNCASLSLALFADGHFLADFWARAAQLRGFKQAAARAAAAARGATWASKGLSTTCTGREISGDGTRADKDDFEASRHAKYFEDLQMWFIFKRDLKSFVNLSCICRAYFGAHAGAVKLQTAGATLPGGEGKQRGAPALATWKRRGKEAGKMAGKWQGNRENMGRIWMNGDEIRWF